METGTIFMQRATETAASCTQAGRRSALNGIISIRIPARGLRPFAPVPAYRFRWQSGWGCGILLSWNTGAEGSSRAAPVGGTGRSYRSDPEI